MRRQTRQGVALLTSSVGWGCWDHNDFDGFHFHFDMDAGHGCQHSTCHLVIVMLDVSVVGQKEEVVYIWCIGCDLVVVLGCLKLLGCCSQSYSDKDDAGAVACFHCCNCSGGSVDDVVHCCFHQADSGCCWESVHFGFGCGIGYDENNVSV